MPSLNEPTERFMKTLSDPLQQQKTQHCTGIYITFIFFQYAEFLESIHEAFLDLLAAGRRSIRFTEIRRTRTADVFHEMTSFLDERYPSLNKEEGATIGV